MRKVGSNGAQTARAIREAGVRLIYQHGFEAMTLRMLAAEIDLQPGALYNHIRSKQDLLFGLLRQITEEIIAEFDRRLAQPGTDDVAVMRRFVDFHLRFQVGRRHEVFIGNMELRSLLPKHRKTMAGLRGAYEARVLELIARGVASGSFRVKDASIARNAIIQMLTGVCYWYRPDGALSLDEIVALYTGFVLQLLGHRAGAARGA